MGDDTLGAGEPRTGGDAVGGRGMVSLSPAMDAKVAIALAG